MSCVWTLHRARPCGLNERCCHWKLGPWRPWLRTPSSGIVGGSSRRASTRSSPGAGFASARRRAALAGMADDPLIGAEIAGRFRITRRLGEGSVGEVYLAEHALFARSFAIKLLKRDYRTNSTVTERFRREALVASRLDHRNIVTISDFGATADGRLFLVMEYVDGPSLGRAIEERLPGVMPLRRAMILLGQIAQGLAAAHDSGVIHRDLKPENLLIASTKTGEVVKILDFGLAKLMVDAEPLVLTRRGQLFGTPMYMSPEQARGEDLDSRTDIYAFGAVAYEALTGRSLFHTEALDELLRKIQTEMPSAPSAVQPLGSLPIPAEVDALVLACLAKDREARPLRISAVGAALERCLSDSAPPERGLRLHGQVRPGGPRRAAAARAGGQGIERGAVLGHAGAPGAVLGLDGLRRTALGFGGRWSAVLGPDGPWSAVLVAGAFHSGHHLRGAGPLPLAPDLPGGGGARQVPGGAQPAGTRGATSSRLPGRGRAERHRVGGGPGGAPASARRGGAGPSGSGGPAPPRRDRPQPEARTSGRVQRG